MNILEIITLPDHIVYYYRLTAGKKLATSFALNIDLLSIRLTGRFKAEVEDPEQVIPEIERVFELDAPCVGRASHPKIKTTITAVREGIVICFIPKDELVKIMSPRRAQEMIDAPPYTKIFEVKR